MDSGRLTIKYPKGEDTIVSAYVDNVLVFAWNDNANIDYPEDLTWGRDLSEIFSAGIRAGKMLAKDKPPVAMKGEHNGQ